MKGLTSSKLTGGIIVIALLILGLAYQSIEDVQYLNRQIRNKVAANRQLDAFSRSADAAFGSDFAKYISFLRTTIPTDATVLIPPSQGSRYFLNDLYLMQYLLFPRHVVTCRSDCTQLISAPYTFIISQDEFPSVGSIPFSKQFIPFSESLGLYAPRK